MKPLSGWFVTLLIGSCWAATVRAQTVQQTELCQLPAEVQETSGLENGPEGCFWTHNDSGNPSVLYCVDTTGTIRRTVNVEGDVNTDWEDLAKDHEGNLYIGNFGNNTLDRTDLRIVKVPSIDTCTTVAIVTDTIRFTYPDQYDLPPVGDYGNFDMEAMVWLNDTLHLFSKDRSSPSTGYCKHYKVPAVAGEHVALLADSFFTGGFNFVFSITAADLSENNDRLVLLNADHLWLFSSYDGSDFFQGSVSELALGNFSQKEGVCFRNGSLYVTDEASFGLGGKMYRLHPDVSISVAEDEEWMHTEVIYDQHYVMQRIDIGMSPVDWELYDTNGRLLLSGVCGKSLQRADLQIGNGVYVIHLYSGKFKKAILIRL